MFLFSRFRHSPGVGVELARSFGSVAKTWTEPARPLHFQEGGFTLLELLIVIALVATLSGLLLGGGRHALESGRVARARAELAAWSATLESYRASHGDYPRSLDLVPRAPATPVDPWNHLYRYAYKSQSPWTNPAYVLFSIGPDGTASESLRAGGFADAAAAGNADNLYANAP